MISHPSVWIDWVWMALKALTASALFGNWVVPKHSVLPSFLRTLILVDGLFGMVGFSDMVELDLDRLGLEPRTNGLKGRCSTIELPIREVVPGVLLRQRRQEAWCREESPGSLPLHDAVLRCTEQGGFPWGGACFQRWLSS
jgi:hypothetical protein